MQEEREALEQILSAKARSGRCIEEIRQSAPLTREFVRSRIASFVLIRYFLEGEDVSGLSFDQIAERSIAVTAGISREMVRALDTSKDCMGSTSLMAKKVLLFRQIEKQLDIELPAMPSAMIETLDDLGDLVFDELRKQGRVG